MTSASPPAAGRLQPHLRSSGNASPELLRAQTLQRPARLTLLLSRRFHCAYTGAQKLRLPAILLRQPGHRRLPSLREAT